jgi:demethylmenaquinone methyltransferase/2-methoxy-6-polyprenyl-1,4-benzoquinol methylase
MMPFNNLGFVFKHFGSLVYSKPILDDLCLFLHGFTDKESVLDIGAGTGMMSEFAYRCNANLKYVAIDPAEGMLKYAPPYLETHVEQQRHCRLKIAVLMPSLWERHCTTLTI